MLLLFRVVLLCASLQNLARGDHDNDDNHNVVGMVHDGKATGDLVERARTPGDLVRHQETTARENSLRYPHVYKGGDGRHQDNAGDVQNNNANHAKFGINYHTANRIEDIIKYEEIVRNYERLQQQKLGEGPTNIVDDNNNVGYDKVRTKNGDRTKNDENHHGVAYEFDNKAPIKENSYQEIAITDGANDDTLYGGRTKFAHHTKHANTTEDHHGGVFINKTLQNIADGTIYDFIVVGSGSAGSVIASRLSENPHYKVLLLEAGKIENPITKIPLLSYSLLKDDYSWQYHTEYQRDFGRGMDGHQLLYPTGKAVGGTPSLVYSRGSPADYEQWAKMGNLGWSYHEVLPYFLKAETCYYPGADYDYHGKHGKVSVEGSYVSDLVDIFVNAGHELGYQKNIDYNTPYQFGFAPVQSMLLHGKRHSPARAYLFAENLRPNLKIATRAHVTKVLIEPNTKIAYGVKYYQKGQWKKAFATKEVVLSAGVINTPQILMLSGVGPKYHLRDLGIPLLKELPVGENFQDHVAFFGLTFTSKKPLSYSFLDIFKPKKLKQYLKTGQGIYRSTIVDAVGFVHTNLTEAVLRPEIQLSLLEGSPASDFGIISRKYLNINQYLYKRHYKPIAKKHTFTIMVSLLHPKSRGVVRLRSADPFAQPLILGNFLNDDHNEDVRTMIEGIRAVLDLSKTRLFELYGIKLHHVPVPGCEDFEYQSNSYWECALRTLSYVHFDGAGTAKMGTHDDPTSVVDPHLRVFGIKGLRVADGSIMPLITGGHSGTVCGMIGEKAADMIKEYWEKLRY